MLRTNIIANHLCVCVCVCVCCREPEQPGIRGGVGSGVPGVHSGEEEERGEPGQERRHSRTKPPERHTVGVSVLRQQVGTKGLIY